ncbi:MAG TPA: methyl-accepting chemotaxis protein, partial [Rhodocyclaceae bacterium]|nr:methyl-accepting chemotaxis protein [Rhodocyclaceae bacterium]
MLAFQKFRVATRLHILILITLLGLIGLSISGLIQLKETMLNDRRVKIQNLVQVAIGIAERNHALAVAGKFSDDEAKNSTKDSLRKLRYNGTEYFFAFDTQGVYVLHGSKAELEGTNKMDQLDSKGKPIVREMLAVAQQGGGFVNYWFTKAGQQKEEPKLSYTAMFQPWGWAIGTGIYIDDVDKEFWQGAMLSGGISAALLLVLLFMGWLINSSILRQLGGEPAAAMAIMQKIADGDLTADVGKPPAGSMLDTLRVMVLSLRDLVTEIDVGADQVVSSAEQINN